jgi:hypothetical protein
MGINDLDSVVNEMDVQDRYRVAFRKVFKDIIFESKYRTDGLAYSPKNKLRMIVEQKHNYDFNSVIERANVVAQVIRYVKTIHDEDPTVMPKVAVIGDENECFVLPVKDIINYISVKDYQWSLTPSSMYKDKVLHNDLINDDVVRQLYIYKPQNEFREIVNKIRQINKGVSVPRTLTEKNIDRVYKYFTDKITLKKGGKKILPNDSVNLFAHIMLHPNSVMLNHNTKQLFTGMFKEPLSISNVESYISFITEFSRKYTPKQKHIFTAILDRLIEDVTRRNQGEFFTPYFWVNKGHEYIESIYGKDWKEKYVVWDPAWGTGNLTRDYVFKELYVSTLNQSDIDIANQMNYNPNATKFRFDFLNDPYESLPEGLRIAIESGRQIIILMNSPYGTARTDKNVSNSKNNIGKTNINSEMLRKKLGESSKQLYSQFLFRVVENFKIKNIAMFSPSLFLTTKSYNEFRKIIFKDIKVVGGFIMNAKEFDGTSEWPILFSIIKDGEEVNTFDLLESEDKDNIIKIGEKTLNYIDNERACDWVKVRGKSKKVTVPNLSSSLQVKNTDKKSDEGMICVLNNGTNRVEKNEKECAFLSSMYSGNIGVTVTDENFKKATMLFTSRKSIKPTWLNMKDEYFSPNVNHLNYKFFENDSIVYSMFNNRSYQSSLRQVTYKERVWDIKNQFFWLSKDEIMDIANQNNYNELYNDARTDSDRYVYNLLFGEEKIYDQLSDEAKDVLDSATNLLKQSIGVRKEFANDINHLNSWDAGYAQLKLLWKGHYPEQFKEFREKYKVFEDKMRPMVYELGFLIK